MNSLSIVAVGLLMDWHKTYELLELVFSFKSSPRCTRSAPENPLTYLRQFIAGVRCLVTKLLAPGVSLPQVDALS